MVMNPHFKVDRRQTVTADEVLKIIGSFLECGFEPVHGRGVYQIAGEDRSFRFDDDWGPRDKLQGFLDACRNSPFGLPPSVDFKQQDFWVGVLFEETCIGLEQVNDIPKIGDTGFADINPLIMVTNEPLRRALGPYCVRALFSLD